MLVLSRKAEESINIGGDISIKVLSVKGNIVRLGLDAPRDINIVRGELDDFKVKNIEEGNGVHRHSSASGLEG